MEASHRLCSSRMFLFQEVNITAHFMGKFLHHCFILDESCLKKNPGDLHTVVKVLILIGLFEGVFI